ncbi:MAG: TauD/TfdA family dioxygenase [Actinomycetota bacterium]|nr:TauD/TfdA family dioxygenase [Actinomycetota bacterium]
MPSSRPARRWPGSEEVLAGLAAHLDGGHPPPRSDDVDEVAALVARHGAAVLTGCATGPADAGPADAGPADAGPADAVAAAEAIFAGHVLAVPEAAEVRSGGVRDQAARRVGPDEALGGHTDGFAYGDHYPDQLLLLCARSSPEGGESFVVDGAALVAALSASPAGAELVRLLASVPVDQTEDGMQAACSPVIGATPAGRPMLRRFPFQRPAAGSDDPERDEQLLAFWRDACAVASSLAPRWKLHEGDLLVADNYRMLHGREPYRDPERLMWRVWVWTDASNGLPSGRLHSDTRYAGAALTGYGA